MIKLKVGNAGINRAILGVLIWLLAFQRPLEEVNDLFSWIDEAVALLGIACCFVYFIPSPKLRVSRNTFCIIVAMAVFVAVGLAGNILFQYQPLAAVVLDLFTNLKFFCAILAGYCLFGSMDWTRNREYIAGCARTITLILFCIFLLDRVFNFYPAEVRYGIKSAVLFFAHPTYLAGSMAFLLVLMTVSYEKKNLPYLVMATIMMAFTLRSKAIASALVFVVLFVMLVLLKKELKLRHLILLGGVCLAIGSPLIYFYYIKLAGRGTRAVLTSLSFTVMRDHFPIGAGFGTYASSAANKYFSTVYKLYDLEYLLRFDGQWRSFLSDTFWPIIIAQNGIIGLLAFLSVLCLLLKRCFSLQSASRCEFAGALYVFVYLIISSTSEPAFHNAVAIPLALVLGILFAKASQEYKGAKNV